MRLTAAALAAVFLLAPTASGAAGGKVVDGVECTVGALLKPLLTVPCPTAGPTASPTPSAAPTASRIPSAPAVPQATTQPRVTRARDSRPAAVEAPKAPAAATTAPQTPRTAPSSGAPATPSPAEPPLHGARPAAAVSPWADVALAATGAIALFLAFGSYRRRMRAARASERAANEIAALRQDVVSNLSHELRTPLTPVVGYASLLASRTMPPAQVRKLAGQMLEAAGQLDRTVDLLVGYATLQSGGYDLYRDEIAIAPLLESCADEVRKVRDDIEVYVSADPSLVVVANETLLRQTVEQLLDNAVKFSPDGGVVRIACKHSGGKLRLTVQDRGIGIAPERIRTIFEEFRQGDTSSTRRYPGVGLGLSFVEKVVRSYGGHAKVKSEVGSGSTFTVEVPAHAFAARVARPVPVLQRA